VQGLGLHVAEGDYEAPGQLELNWVFDNADRTADRLITYRRVGRALGVTPSFMLKPATGMMGTDAAIIRHCGPQERIR